MAEITTTPEEPPEQSAPGTTDPIEAAARFLAAQPRVRASLAEHVPLEDGRCAACTLGGSQLVRWPCSLAVIAARVEQLARSPRRHRIGG
jgi:hypothetical protein